MRERALLIDGKIEIKGIKDTGTTVTILVPLPMAGDAEEHLIN
jgi:signal transduction histidine kinase